MKIGETQIEITTQRPARPSLWGVERHEHTPEQLAEMAERIRDLARSPNLITGTNADHVIRDLRSTDEGETWKCAACGRLVRFTEYFGPRVVRRLERNVVRVSDTFPVEHDE